MTAAAVMLMVSPLAMKFFISLGGQRLHVYALEPAEAHELGDAAGFMAIGLDAHRGEGRSDVTRLHHRDREPLTDEPLVEPLGKVSGFEADMLDAPALVPDSLGNRLRLARSACLLDDAAAFVDDADVRLVERHIKTHEKLHGMSSLIGCDAGQGPNVAVWRKARSAHPNREEGLTVRKRKARRKAIGTRAPDPDRSAGQCALVARLHA